MRTCYWCDEETPILPGAPWGTITRSGAILVEEGPAEAGDAALCQACADEVLAILRGLAWGEEGDHA